MKANPLGTGAVYFLTSILFQCYACFCIMNGCLNITLFPLFVNFVNFIPYFFHLVLRWPFFAILLLFNFTIFVNADIRLKKSLIFHVSYPLPLFIRFFVKFPFVAKKRCLRSIFVRSKYFCPKWTQKLYGHLSLSPEFLFSLACCRFSLVLTNRCINFDG